jgi:superfamily I DNA and/or RNA helicase
VDAVQGGEADLVILTMTRSYGPVQFLLDRHRLNVALSRAREAVITLAHRPCLTRKPGGPFEQLIRIGLHERTLEYVSVTPEDQHWQQLTKRVLPSDVTYRSALQTSAL